MDIKDHAGQIERIPRTPHITLAEDEPLEPRCDFAPAISKWL